MNGLLGASLRPPSPRLPSGCATQPAENKKVEKFRRSLREIKDISRFKSLDKSLVHEMDKVFSGDIPKLMEKAARPGNR